MVLSRLFLCDDFINLNSAFLIEGLDFGGEGFVILSLNPNLSEILEAVSITSIFSVSWMIFFATRKAGAVILIAATVFPISL